MFDVAVPMIPPPRLPFESDSIWDQDVLVLPIPHRDRHRAVVEKETIRLPRPRCLCDPVFPCVKEVFVQHVEVPNPQVDVPGCLAVPVTGT